MPTKIRRLKEEAIKGCKFRQHKMSKFYKIPLNQIHGSKLYFISTCDKCLMQVTVIPKPDPNECEISGEAVALTCIFR